jgi:hypothetical protein
LLRLHRTNDDEKEGGIPQMIGATPAASQKPATYKKRMNELLTTKDKAKANATHPLFFYDLEHAMSSGSVFD